MGSLQYDLERFDGSFSGCGAMRQWCPDQKYYVWDACEEYVRSNGTRRTVSYYNPTNSIVCGAYAKTLTKITIPNKIRCCLIYYEMLNDNVNQKIEFLDEEIKLELDDIHFYIDPEVNSNGFKNLIVKKVYPVKKSEKEIFEEEKIAFFSAVYTTHEPYADTIEEGFALCGWKPYKYFDSLSVFKTRFWDGNTYWCGYAVRGRREVKRYNDMTFLEEISSKEIEVNSIEKVWWHSSPMMFEGDLDEGECRKKYFEELSKKDYINIVSFENFIKDFYGDTGDIIIKKLVTV